MKQLKEKKTYLTKQIQSHLSKPPKPFEHITSVKIMRKKKVLVVVVIKAFVLKRETEVKTLHKGKHSVLTTS